MARRLPREVLQETADTLERTRGNQAQAARVLGISASTLKSRIPLIQRAGIQPRHVEEWTPPTLVELHGPAPQIPAFVHGPVVEYLSQPDNTFTFGLISDNHTGSRYERPDIVADLFEWFRDIGADRVFHSGNYIDGEKFAHDCHTIGLDRQVQCLVDTWPDVGLDTYAISGDDHEGWYSQHVGVDIGRYTQHKFRDNGRSDWVDLGYMEAFVLLKNANTGVTNTLSIVHPGGGTAYAISYVPQKIIASLEGGEKPGAVVYGHWHKKMYFEYRNVHVMLPGCCQDQTPFMRKKGIPAMLGGMCITIEQDPETGALLEVTPRSRTYYNRGYYQNRWSKAGLPQLPERVITE